MRGSSFISLAAVAVVASAIGYFIGRSPEPHQTAATTETNAPRTIRLYQSPMHPWITSDTPGQCTICGMNLVPVYEGDSAATVANAVPLSAATAAVIGVQTSPALERPLTRRLRVNGVFQTDHTRHRILSARVPGRIEILHVDQVGQAVTAGDPLLTLYSPEMLTAQRLYLEHIKAGPGVYSSSQLADARERLLDLGATDEDITALYKSLKPEATVVVRAPFTGTVISRGPLAYAGAYVDESANLFEIGDLTQMWFVFDAYETDLDLLQIGQSVSITRPGNEANPITAPLAFIDPNIDPMTRVAPARVVVANPDLTLRHRQTATAEIELNFSSVLTIPRSAVLFTRNQPLVYVALPGEAYEPKHVSLGRTGDQYIEILGGLSAGDSVVTRAALILEGQAQLTQTAPAAMTMDHGPVLAPATDIASLEPLMFATADAAAALAQDDLPGYIEHLPAIHTAWHAYTNLAPDAVDGPLAALVNALIDGPEIDDARAAFEPFSTEVADLALSANLPTSGKIKVFQCPMSPVLGKGRWVQREGPLQNPFFGSMMLTCGSEIK